MTFYDALFLFYLYSFLGWCTEVVFHAVNNGKFINRGFLIGPVCPIYGMGLLFVLLLLQPVQNQLFLLYLGAVLITTALEFLIGFLSEKILHTRLWDYSNNVFNLGGYVCLKFSLLWGLGCTFVLKLIHPMIVALYRRIPYTFGVVLLCLFSAAFLTDLVCTMVNALKLNGRMHAIDEMAERLEALSVQIGTGLTDTTLLAAKKTAAQKQELAALVASYRQALESRNIIHAHLLKAFPHLRETQYKSAFERIRSARQEKNKR